MIHVVYHEQLHFGLRPLVFVFLIFYFNEYKQSRTIYMYNDLYQLLRNKSSLNLHAIRKSITVIIRDRRIKI